MQNLTSRFATDPKARERMSATADFASAIQHVLVEMYLDDSRSDGSKHERHERVVEKAALLKTIRQCCPLAPTEILQVLANHVIAEVGHSDISVSKKVREINEFSTI